MTLMNTSSWQIHLRWNKKERVRVPCHKCGYGGNEKYKTCSVGRNTVISRELNRGCFTGVPIGTDIAPPTKPCHKTKARMKNIKIPNCSNVFQDLETIGSLSAASISASFYRGAIIADIKTGK